MMALTSSVRPRSTEESGTVVAPRLRTPISLVRSLAELAASHRGAGRVQREPHRFVGSARHARAGRQRVGGHCTEHRGAAPADFPAPGDPARREAVGAASNRAPVAPCANRVEQGIVLRLVPIRATTALASTVGRNRPGTAGLPSGPHGERDQTASSPPWAGGQVEREQVLLSKRVPVRAGRRPGGRTRVGSALCRSAGRRSLATDWAIADWSSVTAIDIGRPRNPAARCVAHSRGGTSATPRP